jgi:hypothetical protein
MTTGDENRNARVYQLLLAIQIIGAIVFVWQQMPEFRQIADSPGRQLRYDLVSDLLPLAVAAAMQAAFWYRLRKVPMPSWPRNPVISHLFLFLGRLSFIFGSALFGLAVFRHLPELGRGTDVALAAWRGAALIASLFALFCTSLEVERLGQAFDAGRH